MLIMATSHLYLRKSKFTQVSSVLERVNDV